MEYLDSSEVQIMLLNDSGWLITFKGRGGQPNCNLSQLCRTQIKTATHLIFG
jgi:hypothetical protein